jgi:hypothetical protein
MAREVFIVAGLAAKAKNLRPFAVLGEMFAEDSRVHYINGAMSVRGRLTVTPPSVQVDAILRRVDKTKADILIITQSLAAVAAMHCIEDRPDRYIQAVSIAPPLPNPAEVLKHDTMKRRITRLPGSVTIPSFSFARDDIGPETPVTDTVDVTITPKFFAEIEHESVGFIDRMKRLASDGSMRLIIPRDDWNTEAVRIAADMPNTLQVDGPHSLYAPQAELQITCQSVHDFALGSYPIAV